MEDDPMLMLEQDDGFGLRIKQQSKKKHELNNLENELMNERNDPLKYSFQQKAEQNNLT